MDLVISLHELAHAVRRDLVTQSLAETYRVVEWFNPFLWVKGNSGLAAKIDAKTTQNDASTLPPARPLS